MSVINNIPPQTRNRESFKTLKMLTLCSLIILKVCTYFNRNKNTFFYASTEHNHNTRSKHFLQPNSYNHLDFPITRGRDVTPFKNKLKNIFIDKCCYTIGEFVSVWWNIVSLLWFVIILNFIIWLILLFQLKMEVQNSLTLDTIVSLKGSGTIGDQQCHFLHFSFTLR